LFGSLGPFVQNKKGHELGIILLALSLQLSPVVGGENALPCFFNNRLRQAHLKTPYCDVNILFTA
jgi:uncharacterized membrane protein (DUF441 family)